MQAELKSIISPGISDFKKYLPNDNKNFSLLLEFVVGEKGKEGGDIFTIEVCTPHWILENYKLGDLVFGRGKLIVLDYDEKGIFEAIRNYCNLCNGKTWDEIANKISRIGLWEFEDYIL